MKFVVGIICLMLVLGTATTFTENNKTHYLDNANSRGEEPSSIENNEKEKTSGEVIKAVYMNEPKESDGHIDPDKTIEALKRVHANAIILDTAYDKQWEDILNFLPVAQRENIKVFVILPDARYGICCCGETAPDPHAPSWYCNLPKPYCRDYIKWVKVLANLSLQYPVLKGVLIDDFECGASFEYAGFALNYIQKVMEAKNRINPNFEFLIGVYLPRAFSDFNIKQSGGYVGYNKSISFSAIINYTKTVKDASFELISYPYSSFDQFSEEILINNEIVWKRRLNETPQLILKKINLSSYDLSNLNITYKLIHDAPGAQWLSHFIIPLLYVNGELIDLKWRVRKTDEHYIYDEYHKWIKQYFDLVDGVILYSNCFDLIEPENKVIEKLLDIAKERIGRNKTILGHFYGAEPWKEPVFPSESYFDTFAKIIIEKTDGVVPWYPFLLSYYINYSSGIYAQPENDEANYDFRFHYPVLTSYELGFYQGIKAEVVLPSNISDACIIFRIKDSYTGSSYYRRWVKEFVITSEEFEQNFSCMGEDCLWFKEKGTVWWDFIAGDEGEQEILIPYDKLSGFFIPGKKITLVLRMRADEFRGAGSYPPEIDVYVTKPVVMVNGREIQTDWKFISGNALEKLWLKSSEKIKKLYFELDKLDVYIRKPGNYLYIFDKKVIPSSIPIIIGRITIKADVFGSIQRVEFYIDDNLEFTDYESPYEWLWNEFAIGRHEIKVIAYDNEGNKAEDSIKTIALNFGCEK